jgi:hypothetical protein
VRPIRAAVPALAAHTATGQTAATGPAVVLAVVAAQTVALPAVSAAAARLQAATIG